jgi:alkylated DNA repair dioxygenase AlkB
MYEIMHESMLKIKDPCMSLSQVNKRKREPSEEKTPAKRQLTWRDIVPERKKLIRVACVPRAEVWYASQLFAASDLNQWLADIRTQVIPLTEPTFVTVFKKTYEERRRVLGFGDNDIDYYYSARTVKPHPWESAPVIDEIRHRVFAEVAKVYPELGLPNFCLVNWYRSGTDKLGAHSDDERDLVKDKPIISLSLGSTRRFVFHNKPKGRKLGEIMLRTGALVIMGKDCQKHYKHSVPEMKKVKGDRWSLTFRYITVRS